MQFETIQLEKSDGVAVLTLNRPERHNAIDFRMWAELPQAWADIDSDPDVVAVIVTGAGEKAFCTGVDVVSVNERGRPVGSGELSDLRFTAIQNHCWKPVVTAVNGMAVGGGLHFVADSDIIICAENATFFDTHVKVGLVAGLEPVGLARRIPLEAALRMALVGGSERMSAERALQIGLVSEVIPLPDLLTRAHEIADMIRKHSPAALARTKRAIWESLDMGLEEGLKHAWSILGEHSSSPDATEGARAFVEKRAPKWAAYPK